MKLRAVTTRWKMGWGSTVNTGPIGAPLGYRCTASSVGTLPMCWSFLANSTLLRVSGCGKRFIARRIHGSAKTI